MDPNQNACQVHHNRSLNKNKKSGNTENLQGLPSSSNPAASDDTDDLLCIPSTSISIPSSSDESEKAFCHKCNKLFIDRDNCDSCDNWYDRKCAGLTNALKWKKFLKKNSKFLCV